MLAETTFHGLAVCHASNCCLPHVWDRIAKLCIAVINARTTKERTVGLAVPATCLVARVTSILALKVDAVFFAEFCRTYLAGHECGHCNCQQKANVGSVRMRYCHTRERYN